MAGKSQKFELYDHPAQMEPLLPAQHKLGPLLVPQHALRFYFPNLWPEAEAGGA